MNQYAYTDYDENEVLLDKPRLSTSKRGRPTYGNSGLPHPDKKLLRPPAQKQRILWARTFMFGLAWYLITMICVVVAMLSNLFIALGVGFGFILVGSLAPNFCIRAYQEVRAPGNREWSSTLRWTCVGAATFGLLASSGCMFFYRTIYRAETGFQYALADPTATPKVSPIGTIHVWKGGGSVARQYAGRSVSFGVWPVCVAPILDTSASTTEVNYWAVESGRCCASTPPSCDSWKPIEQTTGGIGLYYRETYTNTALSSAITDSLKNSQNFGITSNSKSVYIIYGNPENIKSNITWKAATTGSIISMIGLIYIFAKARWGVYEKIDDDDNGL